MRVISRQDTWKIMVHNSREEIENLNDFKEDKAIVWADNELRNYRRAMLILAKSNPNWALSVSEDDEKFINTMIRRGEET